MRDIEIFLQGEGLKDIVIVRVPEKGVIRDLLQAAKEHGVHFGDEGDQPKVYVEDRDESLDPDVRLEDAGIGHRRHVHIHRCHRIEVTVNFNGKRVSDAFSPGVTIGRIKKWAAGEFKMSEKDAAEHALLVTGTKAFLDEDIHLGSLVAHPTCKISFDLMPKVRVEG